MYEPVLELGTEALVVAAYSLVTITLSLLGLAAEYRGLQQFLGGDQLTAVWFAFMGAIVLAFAVTLARERLVPRIRA